MKKTAALFVAFLMLVQVNLWAKKPAREGKTDWQFQVQPQYDDHFKAAPEPKQAKEPWLKVKISNEEKRVLERHCADLVTDSRQVYPRALPPGLAKKAARGKALPPGWQKKLARGEVMPEVVYHEAKPLPPYIIQSLPPQPEGTILVTIEGKVVRLIQATKTIIDILELRKK